MYLPEVILSADSKYLIFFMIYKYMTISVR